LPGACTIKGLGDEGVDPGEVDFSSEALDLVLDIVDASLDEKAVGDVEALDAITDPNGEAAEVLPDAPSACDTTGGPVPFSPHADYLALCRRQKCCESIIFDPSPIELTPFQAEWTTDPVHPLPPCVRPDPDVLIVRARWRDLLADPPVNGLCSDTPCGGSCLPSTGKIFLLNTRTDSVRYVGDEDPASWGQFTGLEPIAGGWKVVVSPEKAYIFHTTTPSVGLCAGVPCVLPWAICFAEIKNQMCLHFPMQAAPGDCPMDHAEYLMNFGRCQTW
jgi:hypothetical protein